jgi:hypothetical protein
MSYMNLNIKNNYRVILSALEDISYHGPLKILLYIKKKGRKEMDHLIPRSMCVFGEEKCD